MLSFSSMRDNLCMNIMIECFQLLNFWDMRKLSNNWLTASSWIFIQLSWPKRHYWKGHDREENLITRSVSSKRNLRFWKKHKIQPGVAISSGGDPRNRKPSLTVPVNTRPHRCWKRGNLGHVSRYCLQKVSRLGNGQVPSGRQSPGRNCECF